MRFIIIINSRVIQHILGRITVTFKKKVAIHSRQLGRLHTLRDAKNNPLLQVGSPTLGGAVGTGFGAGEGMRHAEL